jgi:hypothetical protein
MAAVTMHNLCVCRARQVLSSWLTRHFPRFLRKRYQVPLLRIPAECLRVPSTKKVC